MPRKTSQILNRSVRQFLRQPRTARLATIGANGYPHIVPIWFLLDGDDLIFATDRGERKVRNALANPKGAVVIGGEPGADKAGYLIQGDLRIEADEGHGLARRMRARYETAEDGDDSAAEWSENDTVVMRLTPNAVIRVW